MVCCVMVWYDTVWYDIVRYDVVCYGGLEIFSRKDSIMPTYLLLPLLWHASAV